LFVGHNNFVILEHEINKKVDTNRHFYKILLGTIYLGSVLYSLLNTLKICVFNH
jgi:hypothetical protein